MQNFRYFVMSTFEIFLHIYLSFHGFILLFQFFILAFECQILKMIQFNNLIDFFRYLSQGDYITGDQSSGRSDINISLLWMSFLSRQAARSIKLLNKKFLPGPVLDGVSLMSAGVRNAYLFQSWISRFKLGSSW